MSETENKNRAADIVPAPQDTEIECQCAGATDADGVQPCGLPAVAKWNISVLGNPLLKDFHVCPLHDGMLAERGVAINRVLVRRVSLATSADIPSQIITPGGRS